jgi:hypothetical protein
MVWNGPGVLKIADNKGRFVKFAPGAEVPNEAVDQMDKGRVKLLQEKGMLDGRKNPGRPAKTEDK